MKRIYLDYAASTPVNSQVIRVMQPYFGEKFGNPGSLHAFGQEAIAAVDAARAQIATFIGADFRELIFTASATEANNLAIRGVAQGFMNYDLRIKNKKENSFMHHNSYIVNPRIVISAIEHESILETARDLEPYGVEVSYVPVNRAGSVDLKKLQQALTKETILVSVMYGNNETGAVQPIREIGNIIREFRVLQKSAFPLLHTDAVQAFQFLECNVDALGVDMMTLSAHKIYGPKGVGALYMRRGASKNAPALLPVTTGGNQEFGLRSGTENVPLVAGFARAALLAENARRKETKRIGILRDALWRGIKKIIPRAQQNGGAPGLPHILNVYLPGQYAEEFLMRLDMAGIAASSGSACKARALTPSHVLQAMGQSNARINQSIRFSLGRPTDKKDIDTVLRVIKNIITT